MARHDEATLEHVLHQELRYEVNALRASFGLLPLDGVPRMWADNFALEGCLVHARNLIEFFFPTGKVRDNRVLASDYVEGWDQRWPAGRFAEFLGQSPAEVHKAIST